MSPIHEPGSYVKGEDVRTANTRAEAVALVFDGYKLKDEAEQVESPEVDEPDEDVNPDAPELSDPESPLEGAAPDYDDGSPSEENTTAELAAHQSGSVSPSAGPASPSAYTF
jgi:hypothetical protein